MGDRFVQITRPNDGGDYAGSPRGFRPGHDPGRTVYVGQLRYDTDEKTVRRWFEAYGPVMSVKLIFDKETGRSKGFGFVTFEDERDARDALNDAGGRDLDGAAIKVNIAHGPGPAPGFFGRGGRGGGRNGNFYGGRGSGAPYRPPFGKGVDRRVIMGAPGPDDRYSPGRYSPRGRSRSRSPVRRHDREERADDHFRGRGRSPSRSRSRTRSPSRSRSPRRASASPSPSRSRSRSRTRSPSEQRLTESPAPASARGAEPAAAQANGHAQAHPPAPAVPPPVQSVPGSATGTADLSPPGSGSAPLAAAPAAAPAAARPAGGAKPPPSAEAIKKELLRLRRQEQELGGRVRTLQEEVARKDRQLAQRDADLAEAHAQLHQLQPQLEQYKHWVAELLDGAAKLAGSRARLAAAEEEAKEREGRLAALQRGILQEAEAAGLDLPGLAGRYDDAADEDAAWEQLAATIQESERAGAGGGAGEPAGGAEPQRQGASPDGGLQAAMQEAAMEGERRAMEDEPAAGSGWERAPAQDGSQDHAAGGRFAGVKLTVPAA